MRSVILGLALCVAASAAFAAPQLASPELTKLHVDLHLNAAQEPAWRDYAAAVTANPQAEARSRATQELLPTLPTPRRIALIEATMSNDYADFHRQGTAAHGV